MTMPTNRRTAEHLINLALTRNGHIPNFSLLVGSGASVTSGVRTAQDMISEWRHQLFDQSDSGIDYREWLRGQSWFDHEDEYSMLFETIYDQPSQRRVYVEECITGARPTWGYVYLTNFLQNRLFDVVFTTNFDDLINEACYLYSDDLRPTVAAHDSAIQGIRVTSGRPKIIKLHGDFLYDNIKNTLSELETLETNTKRKLSQFAQEYGLVVLGYSGRDRSVMDALEFLLRDDENFKQGVYWCQRPGGATSGRLQSLLRRDRVYLVEIDGFDEFMADLHKKAGLTLPQAVAKPFEMAETRARLFVDVASPLKDHPVIESDIGEVLESIRSPIPTLPPAAEAAIMSAMGDYNQAIPIWKQVYDKAPNDVPIAYRYADALVQAGRYEELAKLLPGSPLYVHNKTFLLLRAGKDQEVVDLATEALTDRNTIKNSAYEHWDITRINRAIALKRIGNTERMEEDLDFLESNGDTQNANIRAGVAALRGDRDSMFNALKESLHKTLSPNALREFPVFEDYQNDPEFKLLIQEG